MNIMEVSVRVDQPESVPLNQSVPTHSSFQK